MHDRIAKLRYHIGRLEQQRNVLLQSLDQTENRRLTGTTVQHRSFGSGQVVQQQGNLLTVAFDRGEKQFIYPGAFEENFLTTADIALTAALAQRRQLLEKIDAVQQQIRKAQQGIQRLENR